MHFISRRLFAFFWILLFEFSCTIRSEINELNYQTKFANSSDDGVKLSSDKNSGVEFVLINNEHATDNLTYPNYYYEGFQNYFKNNYDNSPKDNDDESNESTTRSERSDTEREVATNSAIYRYLRNYEYDESSCFLDEIKKNFLWWTHPNGSLVKNVFKSGHFILDLSFRNRNDDILSIEVIVETGGEPFLTAFSAASNNLKTVPYKTLGLMNSTLKYLTLKGNDFSSDRLFDGSTQSIFGKEWYVFPQMSALKQLDISNCNIDVLNSRTFMNLTSLENLFLSNNKMLSLDGDTFHHVPKLRYLDLSFVNGIVFNSVSGLPGLDSIINMLVGMTIRPDTFKHLPNLEYLDLSHTTITRNSAMAFTSLGRKLAYLSLCYTSFPVIGTGMFKKTALRAIDLSGNSYAAYNMAEDSFQGVEKTLKYVFFENSNLINLDWVKRLKLLTILGLGSNNINNLSHDTFGELRNLQVLDLSANHIGNWYVQVFRNNTMLKFLDLRSNNINIITSEMLKDFQTLDYLGMADNNFVCDCVLMDLLDVAAANNKDAECMPDQLLAGQASLASSPSTSYEDLVYSYAVNKFKPLLAKSYHNMKKNMRKIIKFKARTFSRLNVAISEACSNSGNFFFYGKINGSTLNFQLIDYDPEHYWCFNETKKLQFCDMYCKTRLMDDLEQVIQNMTNYVVGGVVGLIVCALLAAFIYYKRWHIRYLYVSMKTSTLMSLASRKRNDEMDAVLTDTDLNKMYDIFISYCDKDREWVLQELLPHIEVPDNISLCMHERDFEVGLSILENIIYCMDRSRCLLLVISKSFLLSQWCQFELILAQHRMFEASSKRLILVFIEDIPKNQQPKILRYLMNIRTYIKYPKAASSKGEKEVFWHRLQKAISNISWDDEKI